METIEKRVTPGVIGSFIDSVAGKKRTISAVSGRLLEEAVELCLSSGLSAGEILGHVTDSLHNQSLKASHVLGSTVFPSEISSYVQIDLEEIKGEAADVGLVLKDFCHVANIDLDKEELAKHEKFIKKKFRVSPKGCVYAVKEHIKEGASNAV